MESAMAAGEADEFDSDGVIEQQFNAEDFTDLSDDGEEKKSALEDAGFSDDFLPTEYESAILRGSTFESWDLYDLAVNDYEALSGMRLQRLEKKKYYARAVCRGYEKGNLNSCKVEISARKLKKTGVITIRKVYLIHTCPTPIHSFRNGANRSSWVARKIMNQVRINPNTPMKELNEHLRKFCEASSKTWSVQRARAFCRDQIAGGSKESFHRLPAYIQSIRKIDPEAHAFLQTWAEKRFARLYIAPGSSRNAAKFCRPLIGLDGMHTSGKFPMTILFATCLDGENHIVVCAWAVVNKENGANWTWFLENLRISYTSLCQPTTVFISDRDKGLKQAMDLTFPECQHAHYVQHIRANIKGTMDVDCSKYFKKIADARTRDEYEDLLSSFTPSSDRQEKFVSYVRKIKPEVYAKYAFPKPRYGHNTSNVVEVINKAVKPCRVLPALLLSDYIWNYVMERHYERREHAKQLPEGELALTQHANNLKARLERLSRGAQERKSSETRSLVIDSKGSWAVWADEKHCDCGDWAEFDFPCVHGMCLLLGRGIDSREYIGKVWRAENQRKTYEVPVPPLSIDRLPTSPEICLEPVFDKKTQHSKAVKRASSYAEQLARTNKRLVRKQTHRCGRCNHEGHNARACPSLPPPAVQAAASEVHIATADIPQVAGHHAHNTLRVGDHHTAAREQEGEAWQFFHTAQTLENSHLQTQTAWHGEELGSQTGPSQLTQ